VFPETTDSPGPLGIGPGLNGLPLPTGAQRTLFESDGYDGYDTWAAGPDTRNGDIHVVFLPALLKVAEFPLAPAFFVRSPVQSHHVLYVVLLSSFSLSYQDRESMRLIGARPLLLQTWPQVRDVSSAGNNMKVRSSLVRDA
jgi:hypothetical protein